MNSRPSPAEATVAMLLGQRAGGPAVMIPGAFEIRPRGPAAPSTPQTDVRDWHDSQDLLDADRGLLEREREGGGAPSQRAGTRRGGFLWRLWRTALHPTQRPDIWRRLRAA